MRAYLYNYTSVCDCTCTISIELSFGRPLRGSTLGRCPLVWTFLTKRLHLTHASSISQVWLSHLVAGPMDAPGSYKDTSISWNSLVFRSFAIGYQLAPLLTPECRKIWNSKNSVCAALHTAWRARLLKCRIKWKSRGKSSWNQTRNEHKS